jgi:hypothetical protein
MGRPEEYRRYADAHGYLRKVYQGVIVPDAARMRAAIEALPFERPKLSASAALIGDDFASKLERAVKRSERVLELEATKIEEERESS